MSETTPSQPSPPVARGGLPTWAWVLIGCGGLFLLGIVGMAVLGAIMFPVFSQAREKAKQAVCLSNVKQMSTALQMYAQDWNERFPRRGDWMGAIYPYLKVESAFHCLSAAQSSPSAYGYAYNTAMFGKPFGKITAPFSTPVLYDSTTLTRNASDPLTSMPTPGRHLGQNVIGFADGHAQARAGSGSPGASP